MGNKKPLSNKSSDALLKAMLVFARAVGHVLETRAVQAAHEPLSKSKVQVLRLLGQRGTQSSTLISRYLGVSKPAVTQIVDAMSLRDKLVTRTKSKVDARGVDVKLTPKGRRVFQEIRREQRHLIRSTLRESPRRSAEHWTELLQQVTGALARADRDFEHFCLQCGAHADDTCVLVGGDADCLFLRHRGKVPTSRKRKTPRTHRAGRRT